jgi:hypothetical protein
VPQALVLLDPDLFREREDHAELGEVRAVGVRAVGDTAERELGQDGLDIKGLLDHGAVAFGFAVEVQDDGRHHLDVLALEARPPRKSCSYNAGAGLASDLVPEVLLDALEECLGETAAMLPRVLLGRALRERELERDWLSQRGSAGASGARLYELRGLAIRLLDVRLRRSR